VGLPQEEEIYFNMFFTLFSSPSIDNVLKISEKSVQNGLRYHIYKNVGVGQGVTYFLTFVHVIGLLITIVSSLIPANVIEICS